jgi:hypothetical protein
MFSAFLWGKRKVGLRSRKLLLFGYYENTTLPKKIKIKKGIYYLLAYIRRQKC